MKKILITGCSGFLANYLTLELKKDSRSEIFGITEKNNADSPDMKVFTVDIRDRSSLFTCIEKIRPDLVYHLAAITNVGFSWKNQQLTYEVNLLGTLHLLEALQKHSPACRTVLMSSSELLGNPSSRRQNRLEFSVSNPYALSKFSMELLGELFLVSKGMDIVFVRSFNFTGPKQEKQFVASDFASQVAFIEKGLSPPVIRVGNLNAVRDFSDVRDIARYLEAIGSRGSKGKLYYLCSGSTYSIRDILDILLELSSATIRVETDPEKLRPLDIPELSGDCSGLRSEFDIYPAYSLKQTLKDLLDFWRSAAVSQKER